MIGRIFAITFTPRARRENRTRRLSITDRVLRHLSLAGLLIADLMIAECGFGTSADIPNPHTAILNPQFFWWAGWESNPLPLD